MSPEPTSDSFRLSAAFVVSARRARSPLIELRLLGRRAFGAATATAGLTAMNMYGGLLLIPLVLQLVRDRNAAETGALLFAMGLGSAVVLPFAGVLTDRYGARLVTLVGTGLLLVGTAPFFVSGGVSTMAITLLVRGIALAAAQMPAMTAAYGAVEREEMGDAATLVNIVQRFGGALGAIAVAATIVQAPDASADHGYTLAFGGIVAMGLATLGTAFVMSRPGPHEPVTPPRSPPTRS